MPNVSSPLRPDWTQISQKAFRNELTQLASPQDLAAFLGVKTSQITYYAFHIDKRRAYRTFSIPRRHGRQRRIEAPCPTLKYIQRLIHEALTRAYGPHPAVHGFLSDRSIVTNARTHLNCRYVLNIDLADFFPSITRKRIFNRLIAKPYSFDKKVANVIAALSTNVYFQLPQGSPSSPVIANIVAAQLDADLNKLCRLLYSRYTRYADDITISTKRGEMSPRLARYPNARGTGQVVIGDGLVNVVERHGFQINHREEPTAKLLDSPNLHRSSGQRRPYFASEVVHTPSEIIGSPLGEEWLERCCPSAALRRGSPSL